MDEYTSKTKLWLEERFKLADECGVYLAHQPIYGFRAGHSEPGLFERYSRTYQIIKSLSHLEFKTLLDVGGAEGYKAYLAKELLGVKVTNADLSEEACKRAAEIFNIESIAVDIHELPFRNDEFDIVLCSETLEHVNDLDKALGELIRVAKKAVLITVPHEPKEVIEKHVIDEEIHSHIHAFDLESLNFLESSGYDVRSKKIMCQFSAAVARKVVDRELALQNIETGTPLKRALSFSRNLCVPVANKILNKRVTASIISFDSLISSFSVSYTAILFTILKDKKCLRKKEIKKVTAYEIVNQNRPLHYLTKEETAIVACDDEDDHSHLKIMEFASKEQKAFFAQKLENISFYIDWIKTDNDSFGMTGWAHINEKSSENSKVSIVLQSHKRTYVCLATPQNRPDVTAFFNVLDLNESGFCIRSSTDNLEKGKYRIGLYVEKDLFDRGFKFTDLNLTVVQSGSGKAYVKEIKSGQTSSS